MRSYRIRSQILLCSLLAIISGFGQTPQSLDRLIEQACPKAVGFTESIMDQNLPNWEGYKSVAGLNLVLDKHMSSGKGVDANMACAYLLRNLAIPKDQIATAMMGRARQEAANEEEPWRLVYLLRQMEEMIDREKQGKEVVPFIASFLNDKRPTEPLRRGQQSVPRQQRRVCDGATSALINFMEESGLCEKYDARFGNPGGEGTWEQREQVMRAVVQVLQEKSFLPADFWAKLPPPRLPKAAVTPNSNTTIPTMPPTTTQVDLGVSIELKAKPAVPSLGKEPASSMPWSVVTVLVMAATGLIFWLLMKKRN